MSRRTALFLSAALALLARPAAAQDACTAEASVSAEPVQTIPPDAPIFAPLRWGMTRDQARRALTADGWRRNASKAEPDADWFDGELFGHQTSVAATRNTAGRLVLVSVFVEDDSNFTWDPSLWSEVTSVLENGYGLPRSTVEAAQTYGGPTYCSSLSVISGSQRIEARWETVTAGVVAACDVTVHYEGPGLPEYDRANALSRARALDRQCRADATRARRDRDRLAPGTSARPPARPSTPQRPPPATVPPPRPYPEPVPQPEPPTIRDFAEVSPVLIGGIEAFRASIVYPSDEMRARIEGRTIVRFVVGVDGVPRDIEVVRSVSPGLDHAAVQAIERARFEPGKSNGQAVPVRQMMPVQFQITGN